MEGVVYHALARVDIPEKVQSSKLDERI